MTLGHPITEQVQPGRSMNGGHATVMTSAREATHADAAAIADLLGQLGYPATAKQVDERLTYWFRTPFSRIILAVDPDTRVLGLPVLARDPLPGAHGSVGARREPGRRRVGARYGRRALAGRRCRGPRPGMGMRRCGADQLARPRPGPRFLPSLRLRGCVQPFRPLLESAVEAPTGRSDQRSQAIAGRANWSWLPDGLR